MLEKTARKPSTDPVQERLRQNKANWNKDVSSFINDVIHMKKTMNGWPSKFWKERSRIGEPIPADPGTIIGSLAGDFQDLAQRGLAIVREQAAYAKSRRKRQPKQLSLPLPRQQAPVAPAPEAPPATDLTKQLSLPAVASPAYELVKLADRLESKYDLVSEASNPISRLITRILTPTIGFGESARIRRLRMTLLTACVRTLKNLKRLQKEIVKSGKGSITNSHKIATEAWNDWSVVARGFSAAKSLRPEASPDPGGDIELLSKEEKEELMQQRELEGTFYDYKMRAETQVDALQFLKLLQLGGAKVKNVKFDHTEIGGNLIGEVEVSFSTTVDLNTVKRYLAKVPDGHVMYETVAPATDYTGERTYESANIPSSGQGKKISPLPPQDITETPLYFLEETKRKISDFRNNLYEINSLAKDQAVSDALSLTYAAMDKFVAAPKANKLNVLPDFLNAYQTALMYANRALGTSGATLRDVVTQAKAKAKAKPPTTAEIEAELFAEAQLGRWLGKLRHQVLPGSSSGSRLEIYRLIAQLKKDLNVIMDSLEKGWNPDNLQSAIATVNREMTSLRSLTRALHYTEGEKPKTKGKGKASESSLGDFF